MPASVAGLAAVAMLGSCSRDAERAAPGATVPTTARPTTTSDPYAIPPVIDVAYVNRVLGALDQAVGDVTRMVAAQQEVSPTSQARLGEIYSDDVVPLRVRAYQTDLDAGLPGYRTPPGNQETTTQDLISARPQCIFAKVIRDASAVTVNPVASSTVWVALRRSSSPRTNNPTGWALPIA